MKKCKYILIIQRILVGISAGANVFCARKAADKYCAVATVLPDRRERYLSLLHCVKNKS